MIMNPRHVEVQVLGDKYGNYIHLGERDCTIQRRRQKLIEETPSPVLSPKLRQKIGQAAVNVVKKAKYFSAGTVEFLLDSNHNFYFMEVNTRIQVEHTITEELTGIDLVREQLRIAMGQKLNHTQKDVEFKGHVIQFRINAENPAQNFSPSPGRLEYYLPPGGPHVRVDSACYSGYNIPPNYDSMIAKLIVKGKDRHEAIAIGQRALREFHIGGVHSTIPFHLYMLEDDNFLKSNYDLTYIDKLVAEGCLFQKEG
jgi:acetyl-CoA carboxylase biotin carboxylase subunit